MHRVMFSDTEMENTSFPLEYDYAKCMEKLLYFCYSEHSALQFSGGQIETICGNECLNHVTCKCFIMKICIG